MSTISLDRSQIIAQIHSCRMRACMKNYIAWIHTLAIHILAATVVIRWGNINAYEVPPMVAGAILGRLFDLSPGKFLRDSAREDQQMAQHLETLFMEKAY